MSNRVTLEEVEALREEADRYVPQDEPPDEWTELEWAEWEERCLDCEGRGFHLVCGPCASCGGQGKRKEEWCLDCEGRGYHLVCGSCASCGGQGKRKDEHHVCASLSGASSG